MEKVALDSLDERAWESPKGTFGGVFKNISVALTAEGGETPPFDVQLVIIPPGKKNFPFHAHAAQWEFYTVLEGAGVVRDADGEYPVTAGDAFQFAPGEAHQIRNDGEQALRYYVIANNPSSDACFYPDSDKWLVRMGNVRKVGRISETAYEDGEE